MKNHSLSTITSLILNNILTTYVANVICYTLLLNVSITPYSSISSVPTYIQSIPYFYEYWPYFSASFYSLLTFYIAVIPLSPEFTANYIPILSRA